MKLLLLILSVYLLALSFVPCPDSLSESHEMEQSDSDLAHNKSSDLCSPFCSCACCGSVIFASFNSSIEFLPVSSTIQKYTFYHPFSLLQISLSIWQPPKIR